MGATRHKFVSSQPDGPNPNLVNATRWNEEHVFQGGSAGQALTRATNATDGAAWAWLIPATPVTNENDIPVGQCRFVDIGTSPTRVIGFAYNDNGTIRYFATITI